MEKEEILKSLQTYTDAADSIVITSHRSPDDDSISSVLAMFYWLKQTYPTKRIEVMYESAVNQRWGGFTGFEVIKEVDSLSSVSDTFDLLICTDANQYSRITAEPEQLAKINQKRICIDHHKSQPDDWDLKIINDEALSTAEILYELFYSQIDKQLARLLLLGVLGDTGNLRYVDYTQTYVYDIVKRLVEDAQVNIQTFKASYDYYSNEAIEVAKVLISKQKTYRSDEWPPVNITFIEPNELAYPQAEIKEGINLYIASFAMLQQDVTWSLVFYGTDTEIKVSARSRPGSVNVRKLMEAMEIGSGHDRAAGGAWKESGVSVGDKVDQLVDWLKQRPPILD
jgi:phosphoesterase RecJ-like protein